MIRCAVRAYLYVFATQTAVFEIHNLAINVANEPEAKKPDAVLAIARLDAGQRLDLMGSAAGVRQGS